MTSLRTLTPHIERNPQACIKLSRRAGATLLPHSFRRGVQLKINAAALDLGSISTVDRWALRGSRARTIDQVQ
uniref:Integrase n=1 Tax=Mycena chlorophos TaxID=658473 RepID=A0ABQ0LF23_MYCCL|nr:predicted protein [Mycena chlorophos]